MRKEPLVMVILDGWGIGSKDTANPINAAGPKNINHIRHNYPAGTLQASGIAVGLPWGEFGDSEVGHLTLGAGKVLYQHYPRISLAIKDGSFYKNSELIGAFESAKKNNSRVHIVGLLGKSNIHSSFEHLTSLLEFAKKENVERISIHAFTDGRDSPPKEALNLIADLPRGLVASISGRFFAMDRDLHWDRTKRVYDTLVGNTGLPLDGSLGSSDSPDTNGSSISDISNILRESYSRGLTDEFIEPTLIKPAEKIADGDTIIFFNFREDGMKQLAQMFVDPAAGEKHTIPKNLHITSFTSYSSKLNFPVAFPADTVVNPLGRVLADNGKVQLRIAETEKYAHVTYFFNGLVERPFKSEYRVLIPSKNIARHDEFPQMMAVEVTTRVTSAISEGVYDFILVNYANADIIGHTGNFDAAMVAIKTIDDQIGILTKLILETGGTMVITSDHGNVERMINLRTGLPETTHDPSPVPIYVVKKGYERTKSEETAVQIEKTNIGVISDVAPTVLALMRMQKPQEMTGISLLKYLR